MKKIGVYFLKFRTIDSECNIFGLKSCYTLELGQQKKYTTKP